MIDINAAKLTTEDSKSMFIATEWEVHLWIRDVLYAKYIAVSRIKEDMFITVQILYESVDTLILKSVHWQHLIIQTICMFKGRLKNVLRDMS